MDEMESFGSNGAESVLLRLTGGYSKKTRARVNVTYPETQGWAGIVKRSGQLTAALAGLMPMRAEM